MIVGIREQFRVSERLACRVMAMGRAVYRYQPQPNRDGEVIKLLLELAHGRPEQGFPKLFKRLRRRGYRWNHKRVYRVGLFKVVIYEGDRFVRTDKENVIISVAEKLAEELNYQVWSQTYQES